VDGSTDARTELAVKGPPPTKSVARVRARIGRLARIPREEILALAILAVAGILFSYWWTELDWVRYVAFHLSVYDLGVDYQVVWAAAHGYSINEAGPNTSHLILYAFLIPYWLIPSQSGFYLFLLAFQPAFLALGAFPLYWVAKEQLGRRWVGVALGLAYLAYPAMAGPVWFPFHYEALFPTLFLFGYWLYRRGNLWGAGAFWVVSLFTDTGATFLIAAFGLGMVVEPALARTGLWERIRGRPRPAPFRVRTRRWWFGVFLIFAGAAVFLGLAFSYGFEQFLFFTTRTSFTSGSALSRAIPFDPFINGERKLATLFFLFAPLLALPFWGREERWALIPYLVPAMVAAGFTGFLFPFGDQFTSFVIPFTFVATVRGLERPWGGPRPAPSAAPLPRPTRRRWGRPRASPAWAATGVVVVTLVMATIFAPWGPLNADIHQNPVLGAGYYDLPYQRSYNQTAVNDLSRMIDMVPSSGWVMVQDNIPQLLNRTEWTVPGFYGVGQPLNYLITDPYDFNFYTLNAFGPLPESMLSWANCFLAQGWHVEADAAGSVLLSATGSGPPAFYDPLVQTFTPNEFLGVGPWVPDHQIFDGPYLPFEGAYSVLPPGNYTVTLNLVVDHPAASDLLHFGIGYNYSGTLFTNESISGAPWTGINGTVSVSYPLSAAQYYPGMAFTLWENHWTGPVRFVSIRLAQTAPATGSVGP